MEMDSKSLKMVINIRASISKESLMEKVGTSGVMGVYMKVNLNRVKDKDMEFGWIQMRLDMKDNLLMI